MHPWLEPLARRAVLWNRRRLHRRHQRRRLDYRTWCERYDTLNEATLAALRERASRIVATPSVDLLVPAGAQPLADHQALLQSLQSQLVAGWQLHVALGTDATPEVAAWWRAQAQADPRLHGVDADVAADANRARLLEAATGKWCAFVEPGERWRAHTLLLLIEAAVHHATALLVYADEDRLDADGQRSEPWFKPDFDADALLAHDAVGSPALWQRKALHGRVGAGPLIDGARAFDLVLRGAQELGGAQAVHVPHVLCHRRMPPGPDGPAAARAVQAALERRGVAARATPDPQAPGLVRVSFALPDPPPWLTLVIPTRDGLQLLRRCVGSILERSTWKAFDIVIVDNGSDDPECLRWLEAIACDPRVSVRRDARPFNFAALNNAAVAEARGEFVALVNNDIEAITPGWMEEMLSLAARPDVGAVGARLWYADFTLQHGGVLLGIGEVAAHVLKGLPRGAPGPAARALHLQRYLAVTAACLVVRKSHYQRVGGMDETLAVAFNDIDLCLKLAAEGLHNLWTPHAELFHHESVTRGRDHDPAKKRRYLAEAAVMLERWPRWIAADPYYNPNLSAHSDDFALADPPRVNLREPWFGRR